MKLTKKLIAFATSITLIMGTFSVYASAVTEKDWNIRYTPTAPSSANSLLVTNTFLAEKNYLTSVTEGCDYYRSSQSSTGKVAYAKYWAYATNSEGTKYKIGFSNYTHYRTQKARKITLAEAVPAYYILFVKHELQNNNIHSQITGTISA